MVRAARRSVLAPLIFLFALGLVLAGCKQSMRHGEYRVVRSVGDPMLLTAAGDGIFIGASHAFASEAEARHDAEIEARKAIITSLESQVSVDVLRNIRLDGSNDNVLNSTVEQDAQVQAISRNVIRVQPESWYIETRQRSANGTLQTEVLAWCLMRYTREQHIAMLDDVINSLGPLIEQEIDLLATSQHSGFLEKHRRLEFLEKTLSELDMYQGWTTSQAATCADWRQRISLIRTANTIFLQVSVVVDGNEQETALDSAISAALRKQLGVDTQITRSHSGPGPVMTIQAVIKTSQVIGGLFVSDGDVIATLSEMGAVRWTASEPGGKVAEIKAAGGSRIAAVNRLLKSESFLESLPESLIADFEGFLSNTH